MSQPPITERVSVPADFERQLKRLMLELKLFGKKRVDLGIAAATLHLEDWRMPRDEAIRYVDFMKPPEGNIEAVRNNRQLALALGLSLDIKPEGDTPAMPRSLLLYRLVSLRYEQMFSCTFTTKYRSGKNARQVPVLNILRGPLNKDGNLIELHRVLLSKEVPMYFGPPPTKDPARPHRRRRRRSSEHASGIYC